MKLRNKMIKALIGGELVFFLVCMLISQGTAQQIGPEFPIATTPGWEMSASAAFDGTNYLVGIEGYSTVQDSITDRIDAQLVSQSGTLVGPRITTGRTGGAPYVAFDGTNYLLVWADTNFSTCDNICEVIYGQLISKSGSLIGSPFPIGQNPGNNSTSHCLNIGLFDGTNYFVVWENRSNPDSADAADIYGQFVTPSGTLLGSAIPVSTAAHGQRMPTLAFDGTNILVVWVDGRNQSSCYTDLQGTHCFEPDIYGQLITKSSSSSAGTLLGTNFAISTSTMPRDNTPAIAFDGTNYLIIFAEETTLPHACPTSGCEWYIYGQLVTKAGAPFGSKITINNIAPTHNLPNPVVWNGTNYLVTWAEGFGTTGATVKGRLFDTSGGPVSSEFTLFSPSGGRVPWLAVILFNGSKYFSVVNRGTLTPGTDTTDVMTYTNQDVYGAFSEITINSARCDFNGDGKTDILWRNGFTGENAVWFMDGTTYTGVVFLPAASSSWDIVGTGDFDGDGKTDILWRNGFTGENAVWFMDGVTHIGDAFLPPVSSSWQIVGTGDFNGDGKTDILWRNGFTGENAVWFMDGTTHIGDASLPPVSSSWDIVGTGDFNGDGKTDILWRNGFTGENAVWFMDGVTHIGDAFLPAVSSSWDIVGTGDFNGDGKTDILWRNGFTGENAVWFMDGVTHIGDAFLPPVSSSWDIVGPK